MDSKGRLLDIEPDAPRYDKPDFLGIGAQKAGTGWLYNMLAKHQNIAMPPMKELHYFDEVERGVPNRLASRLFDRSVYNRKWRGIFARKTMRLIGFRIGIDEFRWYLNYLFGHRSMQWYNGLFTDIPGKLSGDITPAYSILDRPIIKEIHRANPRRKIIFLMRDPVERLWSQFRMRYLRHRKRSYGSINEEEILGFLNEPLLRGEYMRTIRNWSEYFPKDQILFGFYDELKNDRAGFIGRIVQFLDLDPHRDVGDMGVIFNKGIHVAIPREYEKVIYRRYLPMLEELSSYFRDYPTNYPAQWLEKGHAVLRDEHTVPASL
ncbi:MAG: sulfotransferase [Planctomycetes bacterium]|nr:sulfotransferase [Planctomycetota bacterium]